MKDQQTQNQFIELRAQGWSLARIATELHLSKTTLVDWNRTARQEIRELKEVEVEASRAATSTPAPTEAQL